MKRRGIGEALLVIGLYGLYYVFFMEIAYFLVMQLFGGYVQDRQLTRTRLVALLSAGWTLTTLLVCADGIIAFIRALPTGMLNGWVVIGWIALTVWLVRCLIEARHAHLHAKERDVALRNTDRG